MSDAQTAIMQEFLVESFDNLSNINDDLTRYEKNVEDSELLNSIYRKIHTLKGSASFLGLTKLQEVTHEVESILDYIREGTFSVNSELIDIFLESFDLCLATLKNIEESGSEGDIDINDLLSRLTRITEAEILAGESLVKDEHFSNTTALSDSEPKVEGKANTETKPETESKAQMVAAKQSELSSASAANLTMEDPSSSPSSSSPVKTTVTDSIVRVNVQLLDKIMNVVGELVITRNQILQYSKIKDNPELNRYAQQLNVITTDLQTDIMTTRMQPVGSVFNKFERIVRDLSRSQNKQVKLEVIGQDTELDKTLIEVIKDPMTHLIRNSLDHGLEAPEVREAAGKNPEGLLCIKAYHEGGQVVIEIGDDGNGINCERVKQKAVEKGIITSADAESMSPGKIHSLIFHPGFSTAEQVTNISGRGVGMDVVKSNIEKISGEVEVTSTEGKGTIFRLRIPLTLAIVPALVVESCGETFAIHQKNLVELVLLEAAEFTKIEKLHGREFFRLRGDLVPIVRLNEVLKIGSEDSRNKDFLNIIVLKAEGKTYGLIVDSILDTQEIVVKPLDKKLKNVNYYAGSTIMGDGRVALIIDAFGFYNQVDNKAADQAQEQVREEQVASNDYESMEVVLFTLEDHRVYGIPLSLINRLEEFDPGSIECVGEQSLIRYRGHSMPLINIEDILNLKGKRQLAEARSDKVNCIVTNIAGFSFGFIVKEIMDIALTDSPIETDTIDRQGLLGTVYINEKLITILDIYQVVSATEVGKKALGEINQYTMNGKVLVVDDSPLYRRVQEDLLKSAGLDVLVAKNGREALDLYKSNTDIVAIITDIEMPDSNGYDLAEKIRLLNKEIPIIAVSTKIEEKDRDRGRNAGFSEHLEKLNKKEVLDTLQRFIN